MDAITASIGTGVVFIVSLPAGAALRIEAFPAGGVSLFYKNPGEAGNHYLTSIDVAHMEAIRDALAQARQVVLGPDISSLITP